MCGHFSLYASAGMDSLICDPCGHKSDSDFYKLSNFHSLLWFPFRLSLYPFVKKPVLMEHITRAATSIRVNGSGSG